MKRLTIGMGFWVLAVVCMSATGVWAAKAPGTIVQKNCMKCHAEFSKMDNVLAGNLSSKSLKAKTLQIKVNNKLELIKFTDDTEVKNVPKVDALKGTVSMRVHYKLSGSDKVATKIVAKPKIAVPDNQLIGTAELTKLVAQGPEAGGYTLIDSRPTAGFAKGHIPTAISIPFPMMKQMTDKLPKDKDELVIFYCQGYR